GVLEVHPGLLALLEADLGLVVGGDLGEALLVDAPRRRGPGGAVLAREARLVHLREEVELLEHARGRRDERLADVRAGEDLARERELGIGTGPGGRRTARHPRAAGRARRGRAGAMGAMGRGCPARARDRMGPPRARPPRPAPSLAARAAAGARAGRHRDALV